MQSSPKSPRVIISGMILALVIVLPVIGLNRLAGASSFAFWRATTRVHPTPVDLSGAQQPNAITTAYTVNSAADTNTGSGTSGTLRYCITQANIAGGTNTITFN